MVINGKKFKSAREKAKLLRMDVAKAGGYTGERSIYIIEAGEESEVPDVRLVPMCKAMKVKPGELV
jgi:DNA-binding XRE family transcriptional regulator